MKTLVVGASSNPERYSNKAMQMLSEHGHEVVAYGLRKENVGQIEIQTDWASFQGVDTVSIYMNPSRQKDIYDHVLNLNPRRVIFNPGTENPEFYKMLEANGVIFEEACTLVLLSTGQYES